MATNGHIALDPLGLLRSCIATKTLPIPIKSADASSNTDAVSLEEATHLLFNTQSPSEGAVHNSIEALTPTRFISTRASAAVDILSVLFCWQNKDLGVGEYISATQTLTEKRTKNGLSSATNLPFAEKLDLVTWLSGEETDSEYIRSADNTKETRDKADGAADVARGDGDAVMRDSGDGGVLDGGRVGGAREVQRMKQIYAGERTMGDRNTVLRGIKPTDFSHVRKYTELFLRRSGPRAATGPGTTTIPPALNNTPALLPKSKPSSRRPEPIILLSPSASSLLRLSNIKSFLEEGHFTPPSSTSTGANILHLTRNIPSTEGSGRASTRFILVEGPENFKPDYWSRVVAVFTTGQAWQFKGYKWSHPAELFSHALGVYVGWRGEVVPESVKGWGRGVLSVQIDKWREGQGERERWRDREVVEEVWSSIERSMRSKGFGK